MISDTGTSGVFRHSGRPCVGGGAAPLAALLLAIACWLAPAPVAAQQGASFIVVDQFNRKIHLGQRADERRPVASLTKIATACVVLDWMEVTRGDQSVLITVPMQVAQLGPVPSPAGLQPGDRISVRDALAACLMASDNIAAYALADFVGRSIQQRSASRSNEDPVAFFVRQMNHLAAKEGMTNTRFTNPAGLDHFRLVPTSTASDMARLALYAIEKPAFNFYTRIPQRQISVVRGGQSIPVTIRNTNELLGRFSIDGVKTGRTQRAGGCMVISAGRPATVRTGPEGERIYHHRMVVVVVGSDDRAGLASALLRDGWGRYDAWLNAGRPVQTAGELLSRPQPPVPRR